MIRLSEDLDFRGLVYQSSDQALFAELDRGTLCAYVGFDPTGDSLHVGHLLQLCNLRRLQLAGNRPVVLIGGATGLIGDPGGKLEEPALLLSRDEVAQNMAGIAPQLENLLDFSGPKATRAKLVNNADWLDATSVVDFLRDVGKHFTVNQMVAKESVKTRFERPDQGISFTEFSYMLLQAYDFLHLLDDEDCRLQMGASDQWGNITTGLELIRRVRSARAYALTSPLLLKADGTKFGKTESGALFLDANKTSPYALHQYFLRTDDAAVGSYLRFFTFLSRDEILALDAEITADPKARAGQRALAREVTTLVHGPAETARAEAAGAALFSEDVVGLDESTLLMALSDAPSRSFDRNRLSGAGLDVVEALVASGLSKSNSAARTAIAQGGAYVNNRRVAADAAFVAASDLIANRYVVLRRGRHELSLLTFE